MEKSKWFKSWNNDVSVWVWNDSDGDICFDLGSDRIVIYHDELPSLIAHLQTMVEKPPNVSAKLAAAEKMEKALAKYVIAYDDVDSEEAKLALTDWHDANK